MRDDVLKAAAVLLMVAVLYAVGSVAWHRALPVDPFASPSQRQAGPFEVPGHVVSVLDRTLFDFEGAYRKATNPFRFRTDRKGRLYLPQNEDDWMPGLLRVFREPSLYQRVLGDPATYVRLCIEPAFDRPFCIRLTVSGDAPGATHAAMLSAGSAKIETQIDRVMPPEQLEAIRKLVEAPGFWKPLTPMEEELFASGLDGVTWSLEFSTPSEFHRLVLWSPGYMAGQDPKMRDLAPYVELGNRMMAESGLGLSTP
jgi:hypothetical protein